MGEGGCRDGTCDRAGPGRGRRRAGPAPPASAGALVPLATLGEQARAYAEAGHADNTRRAYRTDWRAFTAWCRGRGLVPLPAAAATLALYLTDQADVLKVSTLQRRLVAIAQAHRLAATPRRRRRPGSRRSGAASAGRGARPRSARPRS